MNKSNETHMNEADLYLGRKCLALIRDIADRGASSPDPAQMIYSLQELSQVLYERTGDDDRVFEPELGPWTRDLPKLLEEPDFVNSGSMSLMKP